MNSLNEFYTYIIASRREWVYALIVSAVTYLGFIYTWDMSIKKMKIISSHTSTKIDDMVIEVLQTTKRISIALLALLTGMYFLDLPEKWETRLDHLVFILIGVQLAVWINKGITIWARERLVRTDEALPNVVITSMLSWISKAIVWSVVLLTILANVGVNITAFIASLGVGGVAVALAVQSILSDLFASLAIGLDKPFVIGDAIAFGDVSGSVEKVGLKTTHIRSINGEQVICSNTELLKNVIHNYKRMPERRVGFSFGIDYSANVEVIAKIPQIVRHAVESCDKTRFDRAHFRGFGANALEFEAVYFVVNSDFNLYMDIQQSVNLHLMREFESIQVKFASSTMTFNMPPNFIFSESENSMQSPKHRAANISMKPK